MKKNLKTGAIISYILSAICVGIGFYKMLVYENFEYAPTKNAYVGGDAYNYIINANYTTAFFSLAILCAVIGMSLMIGYFLVSQNTVEKIETAGLEQ